MKQGKINKKRFLQKIYLYCMCIQVVKRTTSINIDSILWNKLTQYRIATFIFFPIF